MFLFPTNLSVAYSSYEVTIFNMIVNHTLANDGQVTTAVNHLTVLLL